MMDASKGTAWDWTTEQGRKNFVGMANLMKKGKGNYNKIYDQWIASQPKTNESYAQRFPLAYQSGLFTTPAANNRAMPQLSTSGNNNFTTLELPSNLTGAFTNQFRRK